MMTTTQHKPLFGAIIDAHEGLADELKTIDIAADLALLLHHSGKTRADLARGLNWSRARVTQVMSGEGNLTVQTIASVTKAMGYTFDLIFRKAKDPMPRQPWVQKCDPLTMEMNTDSMPELKTWMSRKTMSPALGSDFVGARESIQFDLSAYSSNQDTMFEDLRHAA